MTWICARIRTRSLAPRPLRTTADQFAGLAPITTTTRAPFLSTGCYSCLVCTEVMASSILRSLDSKRGRTSPTGLTPTQPSKRSSRLVTGQRKKLQFSGSPPSSEWTKEEERSLVRYLVNKGFTHSWPTTKRSQFWIEAAKVLTEGGHTPRTSECVGIICTAREGEGLRERWREKKRKGGRGR